MTDVQTLPKVLFANADRFPDQIALREKDLGIWREHSWRDYARRVRDFSLGLSQLGLRKGDTIAILGDNRPEWVIAELAAQSLGAISVGVYQDSVPSEVQYILDFSEARCVVAEDQEQVDKLLDIQRSLSKLEYIIYHDPRGLGVYESPLLLTFPDVEARGRDVERAHPGDFRASVEATRPNDVAILSMTSGTTGRPKLAMLTHRNLLSMAESLQQVDPMEPRDEYLSFLPLAWIGEQMMTVSWALTRRFTVNFPEEPGTVQADLREVGPHMMFSPPRIWENIVSEIQVKVEDAPWLKRKAFEWSMEVGTAIADARLTGQAPSWGQRAKRPIAELLAFVPVKDRYGLRRLKRAYTGGAALGPDVIRFFHALDVNLKQIYGQTEVSGISVLHRDNDIRFDTVGLPLPDTTLRIDEGGEILTRSPAVFLGYFRDADSTAETLRDGWLHSGDAGYLEDDGHLVVIDRAQDVLRLADDTLFSPQFVENKIKFSPYVREAVVFGGDRPFVTAIIAIDFANTGKWAERHQVPYTTFTDLSQKRGVYDLVRASVERTNDGLPPAARVRRFLLLHKELDADDEELTRTRKVRRKTIGSRYAELVDALYGKAGAVSIDSSIAYQDGRTAVIRTTLRIESLAEESTSAGDTQVNRADAIRPAP